MYGSERARTQAMFDGTRAARGRAPNDDHLEPTPLVAPLVEVSRLSFHARDRVDGLDARDGVQQLAER